MKNIPKSISIFILVIVLFGFSESSKALTLVEFNCSAKVNLNTPLEAVLVVGNTEDGTASSIKKMNEVALIFENHGIKVTKFYNKNTNWDAIKIAAKTASFFVYSGHGSNMGINGNTGGLCLNEMITTEQILKELQLKKNAIILFKSVCGGAGSSVEDSKDIGVEEAITRVSDYSQPFFTIGAACYYADNYDGGINLFLTELFVGKTIEQCYKTTTKYDYVNHEIEKPFPSDSNKQISICSNKDSGMITQYLYINGKPTVKKIKAFKEYNIALVGNPSFKISELMTSN